MCCWTLQVCLISTVHQRKKMETGPEVSQVSFCFVFMPMSTEVPRSLPLSLSFSLSYPRDLSYSFSYVCSGLISTIKCFWSDTIIASHLVSFEEREKRNIRECAVSATRLDSLLHLTAAVRKGTTGCGWQPAPPPTPQVLRHLCLSADVATLIFHLRDKVNIRLFFGRPTIGFFKKGSLSIQVFCGCAFYTLHLNLPLSVQKTCQGLKWIWWFY